MDGRGVWLAAVVILAVVSSLPGTAVAQEQNQAGLVIQFADGRVETQCIAFEGETIAGDEILKRSGREMVIDPSSGMGITVCQIEGEGCDYPTEQCFCECMGGESCGYWNYFYREPGDEAWTYSALGALLRSVSAGGMEAWVWGNGSRPPAADLTFEAVCAQPTSTPEPTLQEPTATETSLPVITDTPAAMPTNLEAAPSAAGHVAMEASATPVPAAARQTAPPPAATPTEVVETEDGAESGSGSYWAFGLIVAALVGAGLAVLLRQRGGQRA